MLKKLIVVYNPRSSKHAAVEREVLAPARDLGGWLVGKYEVKNMGLSENAEALAKILNDGDLVIAAGGDGTAAMAVNGVMRSGKAATLGVLGYGNFNDCARMLGAKRAVEYGGEFVGGVSEIIERFEAGKTREIFPLEAVVDGKHWRFAPCYLSIGLLAESTAVFDEPKVREKLKTGKKSLVFSVWTLAKWFFRNRKKEFLPKDAVLKPLTFRQSVGSCRVAKSSFQDAEVPRTVALTSAKQTFSDADSPKDLRKVNASIKRISARTSMVSEEKILAEAEQKKFRRLMREARKQQILEMGAGMKARAAIAGAGVRAKIVNAKLKAEDKAAARRETRAKMATPPEIIIEGAEVVEKRKRTVAKKAKDFEVFEVAKTDSVVGGRAVSAADAKMDSTADAKMDKVEKKAKKNMACAVEKAEKNRFRAGATDYIAVNGPTVARMMRGGRYYRRAAGFRSGTVRLSSFWRVCWFMTRSILWRVPGRRTREDVIKFAERADVMIQAEGEYERLEGVRKIVVRKAKKGIRVV